MLSNLGPKLNKTDENHWQSFAIFPIWFIVSPKRLIIARSALCENSTVRNDFILNILESPLVEQLFNYLIWSMVYVCIRVYGGSFPFEHFSDKIGPDEWKENTNIAVATRTLGWNWVCSAFCYFIWHIVTYSNAFASMNIPSGKIPYRSLYSVKKIFELECMRKLYCFACWHSLVTNLINRLSLR